MSIRVVHKLCRKLKLPSPIISKNIGDATEILIGIERVLVEGLMQSWDGKEGRVLGLM